YYDRLLRFAISYVSVKEEAEEIVLDVFLNVWMHRAKLKKVQSPDTYLFIAVRNRCLNYLRHFPHVHSQSVDHQQTGIELVDRSDPQKEMERKQLHRCLDEAIAQLPFQCRMVFQLIREERMSYKEVAEILQISVRTVETQLQRALQKLRTALSQQMAEFKARK
ncbi:MAG: RNA polymerase sigma-70 factor, partial [Thermoflavifilum sp.]|nr:RNA polymerase sigma-70 factor [Thermoflavifilum sp.]